MNELTTLEIQEEIQVELGLPVADWEVIDETNDLCRLCLTDDLIILVGYLEQRPKMVLHEPETEDTYHFWVDKMDDVKNALIAYIYVKHNGKFFD